MAATQLRGRVASRPGVPPPVPMVCDPDGVVELGDPRLNPGGWIRDPAAAVAAASREMAPHCPYLVMGMIHPLAVSVEGHGKRCGVCDSALETSFIVTATPDLCTTVQSCVPYSCWMRLSGSIGTHLHQTLASGYLPVAS